MTRTVRILWILFVLALAAGLATPGWGKPFKEARIYIEYNESANDLGFHVSLDAEDWESLEIRAPNGTTIFEVESAGGYTDLGLTELFFEGAEPNLDDFPLEDLLDRFPEGRYRFIGTTVDGRSLSSTALLSHAVPAGPVVSTNVLPNSITIHWAPVTGPAAILPDGGVTIAGYQVIVESFQVTLPATSTQVTLPAQFAASLGSGEHLFEVLAIDASGNQTITEGAFVK
jgi:hypothetical protein